jgi:hypothetical protein
MRSADVSVHPPSQFAWLGRHEDAHALASQTSPGLHACPQAPQFIGSIDVSVQPPLQVACLGGHDRAQVPAEQTSPEPQACPHAPQFIGSSCVAVHADPHIVNGHVDACPPPDPGPTGASPCAQETALAAAAVSATLPIATQTILRRTKLTTTSSWEDPEPRLQQLACRGSATASRSPPRVDRLRAVSSLTRQRDALTHQRRHLGLRKSQHDPRDPAVLSTRSVPTRSTAYLSHRHR